MAVDQRLKILKEAYIGGEKTDTSPVFHTTCLVLYNFHLYSRDMYIIYIDSITFFSKVCSINSHLVNFPVCQFLMGIDKVEIDKVRIEKVEVDKVGNWPNGN